MADIEQPTIARLLAEDNSRTLPIACRFVPFDQWLLTHIDTSWKIKDIKHWILSKCNAWGTSSVPQPPRFRPASPVTFAVPSRRSSLDSGSFGETDDGEDDDWDAFAYDYNRDVRASDPGANASLDKSPVTWTSTHDLPAMPPSCSSLNALSGTPGSETALLSKYVLVSFSCGYILEDEGSLSWYNLRPFEMLELHRVGGIVPLPRTEISYVNPYFESPVQVSERPYPRRSRRPQKQTRSMEEQQQQHTVEWKARWAIIREGVLNLCKDPNSAPSHRFPLSAVLELRGPDDLNIVVKGSSRIVCIKFKRAAAPPREPEQAPWPQDRRKPKSSKTSTWMVLEFPTRTAYESAIRVLHRLAPFPITSTFLSSRTSPRTPTPSPVVPSSPTLSSSPYFFASGTTAPPPFAHFGVQYPEWRLAVFARARKAGLGDVGPVVAHYIFGGACETEYYYHDLPRARSISEGIRRQATDNERFASTSSVPWMEEVEEGMDEDDVESEVEWDGWARDLLQRGEQPTLARASTITPAANGAGKGRPGAVSPSSPSSSSDYEGTGTFRTRAMSFMPEARTPLSPSMNSSRSGGRSRSSTVSASTIAAGMPYTSTTTTIITTYVDRVPEIPSTHRHSTGRDDALGLSLSPPGSPDRNIENGRTRHGEGAMSGVRRIVRGVSIRNAFSAERFAKNFEDALDFVK